MHSAIGRLNVDRSDRVADYVIIRNDQACLAIAPDQRPGTERRTALLPGDDPNNGRVWVLAGCGAARVSRPLGK